MIGSPALARAAAIPAAAAAIPAAAIRLPAAAARHTAAAVSDAVPAMTARLFALMLLRGSVYGAIGPFATVLVLRSGVPAAMLGVLAAAGAVTTLLTAPMWGRFGDRRGRRRVLAAGFVLGAPAAAAMAAGYAVPVVLAYLAWAAISSGFVPLADSLTQDRLGGSRSRFARVRMGASAGYITAVLAAGALATWSVLGWSAPGLLAGALALIAASGIAVRLGAELRSGTGLAPSGGPGAFSAVRSQVGRHGRFLAGLALVFAAVNAPSIFIGPRVAEIGGTGWDLALATAAGSIVEIPAFLLVPLLLARIGSRRLFIIAGVILGLSGLASALAPTPGLVILARLAFGAGYAWMVIPSLGALSGAAAPGEAGGANALHFAAAAAGSLAIAAAGIPLIAISGSMEAVLAVAAVAAPIGAVLAATAWPVRSVRVAGG